MDKNAVNTSTARKADLDFSAGRPGLQVGQAGPVGSCTARISAHRAVRPPSGSANSPVQDEVVAGC